MNRSMNSTRPITSVGMFSPECIPGTVKDGAAHAQGATTELVAVPIPTVAPKTGARILGTDAKIAALAAKTAALVHPHHNGVTNKVDPESLGYETHSTQHNAYEA